jgi:hypothetical protein
MAAAGVCFSLAAIAAAIVIVWGDWPAELAKIRLFIIGGALGAASVGSIAVTIALAVGGPVGRFSVKAGRDGAELAAESDKTVTTTTTETKV